MVLESMRFDLKLRCLVGRYLSIRGEMGADGKLTFDVMQFHILDWQRREREILKYEIRKSYFVFRFLRREES